MDSSDDAVIWSVHSGVDAGAFMGTTAPALGIGPENMYNTDHLTMVNGTWSCMRTCLCSRVGGGWGRGRVQRCGRAIL